MKIDKKTGRELAWRPIPASSTMVVESDSRRLCVASPRFVGCLDNDLDWLWQVVPDSAVIGGVKTLNVGEGFVVLNGAAVDDTPPRMRFMVFDTAGGRLVWSGTTSHPGAASEGSRVVYRDGLGHVVAKDGMTGRLLWKRSVSGEFGVLGVGDGAVVAVSAKGVMSHFSLRTGKIRWSRQVPEEVRKARENGEAHYDVGVGGGLVVVSGESDDETTIFAGFRLVDGKHRWTSSPMIYGGTPRFAGGRWISGPRGPIDSSCLVQNDPTYVLDAETGRIIENKESSANTPPSKALIPLSAGDSIAVHFLNDRGVVERINAQGRRLWAWTKKDPWPPDCIAGY